MKKPFKMRIRVEGHNDIPAFGAFLCPPLKRRMVVPVIYLNVAACCDPKQVDIEGNATEMTVNDRKRLIIETMMHEFGHALERHFKLPVNEKRIEAAIKSYDSAFDDLVTP